MNSIPMKPLLKLAVAGVALAWLVTGTSSASGDKPAPSTAGKQSAKAKPAGQAASKLVPLNKTQTVLIDVPGKRLLVKAKVVLREGLLEMLLCRIQGFLIFQPINHLLSAWKRKIRSVPVWIVGLSR